MKERDVVVVVDVGNSSIGYGAFLNDKLVFQDVISSRYDSEIDMIVEKLKETIKKYDLDIERVKTGIIGSVVPSLSKIVQIAFKSVFKICFPIIDNTYKHDITLNIDDNKELGIDLLADVVALKKDYGYPALLIDLGTVNKTLILDENGDFDGCLFFPGPKSCVRSLSGEAELLPKLNKIERPTRDIAKNTEEAMVSGAYLGTIYSIEGSAKHYEEKYGPNLKKVVSGGFARIMKDDLPDFTYDPDLILKGLYYLYKENIDKFN